MKAHIIDSPEPNVKEDTDLTANCGILIPKAKFVFLWDGPFFDVKSRNTLRMCNKCVDLAFEHQNRYGYGIVPGQETM